MGLLPTAAQTLPAPALRPWSPTLCKPRPRGSSLACPRGLQGTMRRQRGPKRQSPEPRTDLLLRTKPALKLIQQVHCVKGVSCGKGIGWISGSLQCSGRRQEEWRLHGRQHMSVFQLACLCTSGFLSLTLNYLILSGGKLLPSSPKPPRLGAGGGAGRRPPRLQFRLSWVIGGSKRSCENRLGCLCWPPSSKKCSQACSQAASFQRV